jgi:hypothetical protein
LRAGDGFHSRVQAGLHLGLRLLQLLNGAIGVLVQGLRLLLCCLDFILQLASLRFERVLELLALLQLAG